ncbi:MAG: C4-dicarboxylate ABC transporter substrate-binding protein, partial [Chloroflexi bacterium]|nr:C4-dicarboxylate ABC transporter substrate-binding protein [Chloroflexota bacterium]
MIGYENHPGEPVDLGCNHWKKLIEERSGGTIKVQLYPSSQLGSKNELIDQMLAGIPVITLADGAFYADRGVPDFGIVFGPYLFDSWDDCWKL